MSFECGGPEDGWENRLDDEYRRHANLRAAADATEIARGWRQDLSAQVQPGYRHSGTDDGAHHWSRVTGLRCPCGCQQTDALGEDSTDPVDILGRQVVDQLTAYEYQKRQFQQDEHEEARAWLESHRPVNRGPW